MDDLDNRVARSQLEFLREALQAEVSELARRLKVEAQLQELGGKLEKMDTELEAKRRMLRLVEDTELQLALEHAGLSGDQAERLSGEAITEVRLLVTVELAVRS
jgi:hypothetical protein